MWCEEDRAEDGVCWAGPQHGPVSIARDSGPDAPAAKRRTALRLQPSKPTYLNKAGGGCCSASPPPACFKRLRRSSQVRANVAQPVSDDSRFAFVSSTDWTTWLHKPCLDEAPSRMWPSEERQNVLVFYSGPGRLSCKLCKYLVSRCSRQGHEAPRGQ